MSRWLREIAALDPEHDAQRIVFLDGTLEFPWDTERALELAFYRTYAIPSIAQLLGATGETAGLPQKRYDDTRILISTFCEHGYDSGLGRRAISQMNRIHGRFAISNDDYLYVLSGACLRADPVECAIRLASADRDREARDVPLLA